MQQLPACQIGYQIKLIHQSQLLHAGSELIPRLDQKFVLRYWNQAFFIYMVRK